MDAVEGLKVPQRYAQMYKTHLSALGALDRQHCLQKHLDGTVTLPILPSTLSKTDLLTIQNTVDPSGYCEQLQIQVPQLSKKGKVRSDKEKMIEALQAMVSTEGEKWNKELEDDLPSGWQRHGDLLLFGEGCFSQTIWGKFDSELWDTLAHAVGAKRVAQIKKISQDGYRTPVVKILLGEHGQVAHIDNQIRYEFDVTKCMFSFGNITEKLRIASFNCKGETVVDLYAGIGYFTLPYLVHAGATHVHACEWNPDAVSALKWNLQLNKVDDRCTVHQGDNKQLTLSDLADRVNLGLIPSSEAGWPVACRLLRRDIGGILHIHQNVTVSIQHVKHQESCDLLSEKVRNENGFSKTLSKREVWTEWAVDTSSHIETLLREITAAKWRTCIKHIEHVKSYAPHIDHIVLDLECKPIK